MAIDIYSVHATAELRDDSFIYESHSAANRPESPLDKYFAFDCSAARTFLSHVGAAAFGFIFYVGATAVPAVGMFLRSGTEPKCLVDRF